MLRYRAACDMHVDMAVWAAQLSGRQSGHVHTAETLVASIIAYAELVTVDQTVQACITVVKTGG